MSAQMTRRVEMDVLPAVERDLADGPLFLERLTALERLTSFAAHEIRNPLAALRAMIQLAMMTDDSKRRDAMLRKVIESIDDLSNFLTELLALAGSKKSMLVPLELRPIITGVLRLFAVQADMLGVRLTLQAPKTLPRVWGNGPLLRHAMMNLVKNSLEAMPEGGSTTISVRHFASREAVCIAVQDTGTGIPEAHHEQLFTGVCEGRRGAGVGLPFVYRVITDVHRGHLRFETKEGVGTTFYVELSPVAASHKSVS